MRTAKLERTIPFNETDRKLGFQALTPRSLLDASRAFQVTRIKLKLLL
jgi:hypothetical protein